MKNNDYKGKLKDTLILEFCLKQNFVFDCWVCESLKKQVVCSGYIFDINDIYNDLVNNCEKGLILHWFFWSIENDSNINYLDFSKQQNQATAR